MKKTISKFKAALFIAVLVFVNVIAYAQQDTSLVGGANEVGQSILEIIFKAIGFNSALAGGIISAIMLIVRFIEKRYTKNKNAKKIADNTSLNIEQAKKIIK